MTGIFEGLELVCPRCRGAVDASADAFRCAPCGAVYPVVAGIPDFRVAPDPWIAPEADRAKGLQLEGETRGQGFEAMVRAYWAMTPETPFPLAERFIGHVLGAEQRSRDWLRAIGRPAPGGTTPRWLDIGCGTADLAAAAWPEAEVVGIDVAFRWLMVARRRLIEKGVPVRLVCCNAEALPFADATFDQALSVGTLEHCRDLNSVLSEARRVLASGGQLRVRTVNRYSALPDPHVGVWGVGWVPRRWADGYSRWIGGKGFLHHRPRSARELGRALQRTGFVEARVEAALLLDEEAKRLSAPLRRAAFAYEGLRRAPLAAVACRWLAPLLELEAKVGPVPVRRGDRSR